MTFLKLHVSFFELNAGAILIKAFLFVMLIYFED